MGAVLDIAGERFGRLEVIKRVVSDGRGNARWLCRCDCGEMTTVLGFALRGSHTRSCGCLQREHARSGRARMLDLTGQTFGRLAVVARASRGSWLCRCACGTETEVRTNKLTGGWTRSCGCLAREEVINRNRSRKGEPRPSARRSDAGYSAAHHRIYRAMGKASDCTCVNCGNGAAHWSYTHDDPNELLDDRGRSYSLSPSHYVPRCVPCHKRYDASINTGGTDQ